jgi:trans-aconitate 2-methyltransferase
VTHSLDQYAKQYVQFEDERTRPVRDLLAAVPQTPLNAVIDLGCGPGNSTEALAARAPAAAIRGLDASADMIDAARKRLPDIRFDVIDITQWDEPGSYDLILSNAVLQWVPAHDTLFPKIVGKLAPGGHLAVQMPDNLEEPAHRLMREIAAIGPWADKLKGAARTQRFDARHYYTLLSPLCSRVDVWRTTYYHPLRGGADAVVPRGAGRRRARCVPRPLSRCRGARLSGLGRRHGSAALPAPVHRGNAQVTRRAQPFLASGLIRPI